MSEENKRFPGPRREGLGNRKQHLEIEMKKIESIDTTVPLTLRNKNRGSEKTKAQRNGFRPPAPPPPPLKVTPPTAQQNDP